MDSIKTVIVTGCNKGIGKAIVEKLASHSYSVVMACRNLQLAEKARLQIISNHPNSDIRLLQLDLLNNSSIDKFSSALKQKNIQIDALINNAGITCPMSGSSILEVQNVLKTNFYGTTRLTESLLPNMRSNSKVLFAGGFVGKLNQLTNNELKLRFKDPSLNKQGLNKLVVDYFEEFKKQTSIKNGWPKWPYAFSKLAINYYARLFPKAFQQVSEKRIQSYAYCPGYVKTDMTGNKGKLTVYEGAETPLFLTQLSIEETKSQQNGGFFQKCKLSKID